MKTFANIQKEIISHLKSSARSAQGVLYSIGLVVTLLLIGTGNVCAQGTESFENLSNATDYKSRSWTGDNGRSWSATNARTDYKTKGSRGLTFKASTASTITMSITNDQKSAGIGVLSFKYYFPFSDSGKTRKLSITIGSTTYTTGDLSYTSSATSGSITINSTLSSNTLTINIDNSGGRICVDEFSWTAKPAASATLTLKLPKGDGTFVDYETTDKSKLASYDLMVSEKLCYGSAAFWGGSWNSGYWTDAFIDYNDATSVQPTRYNSSSTFSTNKTLWPLFVYGSTPTYYHTDPFCPSYHVTYDGNGKTSGTVPSDATDYDGGETVTVKSATLTKTNYTFTGWNTESDGSGTHYAASGSATFTITEDVTLYAEWCRDLSTLTSSEFDLEASSITGTSARIDWIAADATKYNVRIADNSSWASATYKYSADNVTSTDVTRTDLTPATKYWVSIQAKNDCGETSKVKTITFTTLAAYVITYYKNDGSATSATESKTEGVNYTISSDKFSRDGYTLSKWNTQAGGGGTDYAKGATYSTDAPLTLFAVWTANNYTITLDKNGGSGGPANVSATYGVAAPSVGALPTKADKNFAGYWTGEGGTGTMVVDASGVWVAGISGYTDASKNWIGTEGKTIYAKWVDKTYTNYRTTCSETYDIVLHDNNGGSHNGSAKVAADGKQLTSIVAPTRDGYSVEGYYAEAGTSTKIADASGVLQSDKTGYTDATGAWTKGEGATLYAKWTATNYTITYDGLEGASNSNPTSYNIATPTITLVAPGSREGYTFAGWTCGGSPITQIAVGSTGDKTITATWTANTYTVRFNANGGSGSMSNQNFTYGVAQNLTSNGFTAPDDKSFGGWTTNSDGTGDFYTNGQSVSNLSSTQGAVIDLYAKWVDCDLYTVTLNVNGDTWKTVEQSSCGTSIDLSGFTDVPNCGGGYTLRGWSTTNSATPMFDAPTITTSSTYTPESDVTLYAVYSHSAVVGTRVMSTASLSESEYYYVVASGYNKVMAQPTSTTNLAATIDVAKSADGSKCVVTGSGTPLEIMLTNKTSSWMISKYNSSTGNNWYYYSQSSRNALAWYDEDDYWEWWYEDDIEKYGDWYDAESYVYTNTPSSRWTISIDGSTGVATISETTNSRTWKYNSSDGKFGAYTSGNKPVSLYQIDESGLIYTTQPDMTAYTITKGVESNGTFTIAEGVACSGQAVAVSATPASGYVFSGWTSSNGGSFGNASSASTTFTPTANTTVTANFVAATPHDITWMVNGTAYTTGEPTNSMTAGTSFSTMTLPTAPANNTLSSACGAVANQFVGWSTTDMGFATGQSAPAKLFTTAAGAGAAYGNMGDDDVVFYAVFAQDGSSNYMSRCANTYSITLDKKEGTTDGTAVATEMGSALDITLAPVYAGHSVEGYYAETGLTTKIAGADGTLLAGKSGYTDGSGKWTNTTSPLTLYTKWTLNSHTLTWNLDGGSISAAGTPAGTVAYGTALVAPTVTKTGYTFNAWSPAVDATMPDNDVTYTATWTAKQYAITYKDKDDAAYSGDKTDGRPTGCPANHTYGSATDLPYGVKAGYRFDGWFTTSACTGDPITSIASDEEGPFTLYAKWTASHTFTFSKNGVVDGTLTLGQVEGGNVIMPNTTVDCGLWTTFEGWVIGDVVETTTEPTTIYKPGDIYVAGSSNQEFKAVYSKHEGDATVYYEKVTSGPKSGTYVMVSYPRNDIYYIYTSYNASSYCNQSPVTISDNGTVSAANATSASAREVTVRAGNGANTGKFAIYDGTASKYLTGGAGAVGVNNDITFCWNLMDGSTKVNSKEQIPKAGAIHSTTNTTYLLQLRNHSTCDRFQMYANTQTDGTNPYDVYLYRKRVAGTTYYTTAPASCDVPTKITVSYNDNKANAGDQTISGMPSGTTLTFTDYPDFDTYTVGSAPTDPTGYHFTGWNTSAEGGGDSYTAGSSVTTFGYTETITLYAQWERVYTVTLYDNGVEQTRLTQASAGANVTLPSGNNCTPGSAFTFVGWTDSPVQLNAEPVLPNIVSGAGEWGDDELTGDVTLYSVYSKSVAGCDDFAAGVSGAYKMYYDGSKYATTAGSSGSYTGATSGTAEVFYIAYAPAHTGYTIRTSTGFVGWNYDGSELTKANATPYYWKISGSSSNWVITPEPSAYTKQLKSTDGSKFQLYAAGTTGKLLLQKSAMTYYYNTAICGDNSITFHDGGGTISGTPTTPTGASWNSGTHILSGLEDCDKITTFPTASYDGWTFIGWSTEDYSNSGKHTADHAEENASTDEPDGSIIYKTGGNPYVVRGGSIDLYPIFTRFPDNEPFNTESGGDYYIYYLKPGTDDGYGANIRVYAGDYDGEKRYSQTTSCAAATEFTFTKDGDIWHIFDKTTSKYVAGLSKEDWLLHANDLSGTLDDWTLTIKSGNQFYASCQGGGRYISFSTSANYFMDYSTTANPGICLPVYLGSCTERIFSSEPNPTPTIDLTGEPMVTSSVGQQVRATETMTLSASHLGSVPANKIIVSGTNLKFATTASATPSTTLSLSLTEGNLAATTIYVYYTPTATEDGLENIIVTAQAYNGSWSKDPKATGTVHCRHLPADFVIAAKWGDKWYALPNTCAGEGSNTAGVLIEVNDANAPTAATAAPHTAKWGMRQTKAGSRSDGSYNDRLVFTERTTAVVNNQKTLYNYNQAEVFTSATYENYNNTNPERYEWIPVTTDFGDYELTNANDASHHLILRNGDGLFVAQNSDKSYDGKVRLLPATFYEEAPVQILEWKQNSVVVMYTGTETSATTKVGTNSTSSAQTLSTHKLTHGIYELTTGQSMSVGTNTNKNLLLTFGSTKKFFEIPVIITGSTNASSGYDKQDVIITKTGKLTAQSTKYSYRNIYVYGGGKLKIASGTSLGVNNIILRAGGITTSGIGSSPSATYEYIYPQVELKGTLTSTKTNIKYEYITDYDHWYHLVLPFDGNYNSITYPVEYYGTNVAADNHGSWVIKRYDGATRATGNYNAWVDIETDGDPKTVYAGHGYIYWGAPKKLTIGGDKQRQKWGIQRITMPVTAAAAMEAENANKVVGGLGSYSGVSGNSDQDNDQGWNLIGDPYLTNITNLSGTGMHTCKLVEVLDANDNWTGRWEWNDETSIRYLTIPDYHFDNYTAKTIPVAVGAGDLNTGHTFFVQIEGEATGVTFEQANRASLMPALYAKTEQSVDIETGVVLSDETKHDEVNFWIKDGKTAEYEYNADYPKTPNSSNFNLYGVHSHGDLSWIAISPEIAEGSMAIGYQVPTAGEYRLSLSETYVTDKIEQLLVTDHEMSPEITTNLLVEDYLFQVNQAETNNERFTVSIKIKSGTNTATDIDDIRCEDDKPMKFIYHEKMYILRGGKIYDATGKQVREIK